MALGIYSRQACSNFQLMLLQSGWNAGKQLRYRYQGGVGLGRVAPGLLVSTIRPQWYVSPSTRSSLLCFFSIHIQCPSHSVQAKAPQMELFVGWEKGSFKSVAKGSAE